MYDADFESEISISHATAAGKPARKVYLSQSVLEAARERLAWVFDRYATVVVSVSGGKDSTVLLHLARAEALRRGREVHAFFLDQEAEYASTVEVVRAQLRQEGVVPHWLQVPVRMTNAASLEEDFLRAWWPGEEWMREREPDSVHELPGAPDRFYPLIRWWEQRWGADTALLVGLRSEESLNRYGAVTRHPAVPGVPWSSRSAGEAVLFYPIYDWTVEDVWTYLGRFKVPYNRVYDWMWAKGRRMTEMRVSNLIHERAFVALADLQEFEPGTYERLLRRLRGVRTAALYAGEPMVYNAKRLPKAYKTWREYRDFLLSTLPPEKAAVFHERFARQKASEAVHRQQVRQLLINDWENNIPVVQLDDEGRGSKEKWMELL